MIVTKKVSNKEIVWGIIGGLLMFTVPTLCDMYVRPFLHSFY
jgi:hypothetical protein